MRSRTTEEKKAAFAALYRQLRGGAEDRLLARDRRPPGAGRPRLRGDRRPAMPRLAFHPVSCAPSTLCAIGVHTLTHPMLAKHDVETARRELAESRRMIEAEIGAPARHLAYPVGDPGSAGSREFNLAQDLGFASAVTTRPGMVFSDHRSHRCALPRLSINGNWQTLESLEVLLSGVPFALWNKGRRVNVD